MLLFIFLVLLDQGVKYLILRFFPQLTVFNKGISFGFYPSDSWLPINLLILGALLCLLPEGKGKTLIIAGGTANILDRLFRGEIIDFINLNLVFQPFNLNFNLPLFNLADVYICLGVAILIFRFIYKQYRGLTFKIGGGI